MDYQLDIDVVAKKYVCYFLVIRNGINCAATRIEKHTFFKMVKDLNLKPKCLDKGSEYATVRYKP